MYFISIFFDFPEKVINIFSIIQISVTFIFTVEFILRMIEKPFYRDWWIDLLAISDIITPAVKSLKGFRIFKSLRIIRTIRLLKINHFVEHSPKITIYNNITTLVIAFVLVIQITFFNIMGSTLSDDQLDFYEGLFFVSSLFGIAFFLLVIKYNLDTGFDKPIRNFFISQIALLELKDDYTAGHSKNVSKIAYKIGQALGYDKHILNNLRFAGLLHDIGKIGVVDSVLLKPGRLNSKEFDHIKTHPVNADFSLKALKKLLPTSVYRAAMEHHEFINGNGYPLGLKGDEIHIFSRIISVSDTLDALITKRPYRDAMSFEDAFNLLETTDDSGFTPVGDQLDPEIYYIGKNLILNAHNEAINKNELDPKVYKRIIKRGLKIENLYTKENFKSIEFYLESN